MKPYSLAAIITLFALLLSACGGGSSTSLTRQEPIVINQTSLPTMDSLRVVESDVLSAGQPTADQLRGFAAAGVTTVIDLRGASENRGYDELETALNLNLDYVAIPISGIDDMSEHTVRAFADAINRARGPVLVHCRSGSRVGAMVALRAGLIGVSTEDAMAAGIAAGMGRGLQGPVRQALQERQRNSP